MMALKSSLFCGEPGSAGTCSIPITGFRILNTSGSCIGHPNYKRSNSTGQQPSPALEKPNRDSYLHPQDRHYAGLSALPWLDEGGAPAYSRPTKRIQSTRDALPPLYEIIEKFGGRVVHLNREGFDPVGKRVEGHDGGHGDEKTESRRYQRLGDAPCDRFDPHDILYSHALKRVDDTDGGSKQADERSNGTDRREPAQPSFQVFDANGCGALQRPARGLDRLLGNLGTESVRPQHVQSGDEHLREMAPPVLLAQGDRFVDLPFHDVLRNGRGERARLPARLAVRDPSLDHDAYRARSPGRRDSRADLIWRRSSGEPTRRPASGPRTRRLWSGPFPF